MASSSIVAWTEESPTLTTWPPSIGCILDSRGRFASPIRRLLDTSRRIPTRRRDPPCADVEDALDDLYAEDVTGVRTFIGLPSRVDPGVAADEASLVPHQPVRVARPGRKIDRHH